MQADRAYNGSAKYVKHQKLDQSASLFVSPDCVNPAKSPLLHDRAGPSQRYKSFNSYGLYGKCSGYWYRCSARAESFSDSYPVPLVSGGTGGAKNRPYMFVELRNLAGNP